MQNSPPSSSSSVTSKPRALLRLSHDQIQKLLSSPAFVSKFFQFLIHLRRQQQTTLRPLLPANPSIATGKRKPCTDEEEEDSESSSAESSAVRARESKKRRTTQHSVNAIDNVSTKLALADGEVSTKLVLFDKAWDWAKEEEHEQEEERQVSSDEKNVSEDRWKIRKKITNSNVRNPSAFLLGRTMVREHVLPFLTEKDAEEIQNGGLTVAVWDEDTKSVHGLIFQQWRTSLDYILNGGWNKSFVKRRNLKEGDEIGLYWDSSKKRLNFSVLSRAHGNKDNEKAKKKN